MFAFETDPVESTPGTPLPDYSRAGNTICAHLSVLFGKRFDSHGLVEGSGRYHVPTLAQFGELCDQRLPQNSHESRIDFPVPLNLGELSRIQGLLSDDGPDPRFRLVFAGASKFYLQALQNVERDPEVAYLHLITAGEILSNFHRYDKDALLDGTTRQYLDLIRRECTDGPKVAEFIAGKLLQVKRRFVETITQLVDPSFFDRSESRQANLGFKAERFRESIAAAYDLRSKYVHTGVPFGAWISENFHGNEIQLGQPEVADRELRKILAKAPTYIGLERVIRYCLLRLAERHGAYVAPPVETRRGMEPA